VTVCTTDEFTKSIDALVCSLLLMRRRRRLLSLLFLWEKSNVVLDSHHVSTGNIQGMGNVEYGKCCHIYVLPVLEVVQPCSAVVLWSTLGHGTEV